VSPPKGYKKTGSTYDAKRIMRAARDGGYRKICPVTNNLPTRMTRRDFTALCRLHQASKIKSFCNQTCFGKELPECLEITIKSIEVDK